MVALFTQPSSLELADDILVLRCLDKVVAAPKENQVPSHNEGGRVLPIQREIEICDNLAFLAATTDDCYKVLAVCVEEDRDKAGLTVVTATNTTCDKAVFALGKITKCLQNGVLGDLPRARSHEILFQEVVDLNSDRILLRMRSSIAPKSKRGCKPRIKPPLIPHLQNIINELGRQLPAGVTRAELQEVKAKVLNLRQMTGKMEQTPEKNRPRLIRDFLCGIVKELSSLTHQGILSAIINSYPKLSSGSKVALIQSLGKIGRYFSASYDLACATRHPDYRKLFRRLRVQACDLLNPPRSKNSCSKMSFEKALARISNQGLPKKNVEKAVRKSSEEFSTLQTHRGDSKIHAEIKLLFFYETHPKRVRPRVIASNKSACYLCNLFIRTHGHFYTPRTHGRLYEQWRLPEQLEGLPKGRIEFLAGVVRRFDKALRSEIISKVQKGQFGTPEPNESVLLLPGHWSPSVVSKVSTYSVRSSQSSSTTTIIASPISGKVSILKSPVSSIVPNSKSTETVVDAKSAPAETVSRSDMFLDKSQSMVVHLFTMQEITVSFSSAGISICLCESLEEQKSKCWLEISRHNDLDQLGGGDNVDVLDVLNLVPGERTTTNKGSEEAKNLLCFRWGAEMLSIKFGQKLLD